MADEQPPVEGEEPAAEETGAPAEPPAAEEAAPAAASEQDAPAAAQQDESGESGEESAAPEAAEEPAPATAEEPAPAVAQQDESGEGGEEPAPAASEDVAPPASAEAPGEEPAPADAEQRRERPRSDTAEPEPDVVLGAHLEPDLVLEESRPAEGEYDPYATDEDGVPAADGEQAASVEETPVARTPLEPAADARYRATGKRKRAIARVILKPGSGTYTINGKELDTYFPRVTLQKNCRLPLQTTGNDSRMDVVAKIHGGGVSSQAIALRHGISRALVEADPNLRTELKRQGFLTRDARVKERKKAGLKKARKRPQFSKR